MARTAALPRVEGLAPPAATRGTTPGTVHLHRPVADPRTGHGDRRTTFLPEQRHPAAGPPDAPTVRLPVVRDAGASGSRVRGIDAARGLALLGMIAVHTLPTSENGELTTVGLLAGGTSAALFGLLVGVSVALLTGRRQVTVDAGTFGTHAARLAVRGLTVGVLGLALGEAALGDVDIILTYYGVLFLLAIPLILLPTRALFALGAVLAVVAPITSHLLRTGMPPAELIDPSFTALVTDPAGLLTTLFLTGAYPIWPWLTYLCVGMAVGRCSLATTRTAAVLAACGVALVAAAAAVSHLALVTAGGLGRILADPGLPAEELRAALTEGPNGVTPATTWWWLAVDTAHSSTPLDLARTVGTSLAVLGAMLLVDRALARGGSSSWARIADAARSPLAAAGSMTLTFYTLHVVVAGLAAEAAAPWALYLAQVTVALAVGLLWQRFVGRGPLEAGVSTLTDVVAPAPSSRSTGRPAPTRPWRAGLVAALVLAAIVGGAFAVAGDPTAETSSSSATSEQVDGAEVDGAGVDGAGVDGPGSDVAGDAPEADQPVPSDEDATVPQDEGQSGTEDD
ncbi:heparan-alpha-glucosaminide N-acetyltransferase domain-containing protein [Actinomycetospora chibensis]|uniref:Heparan-alpha-glucosaminide N-acetyltransferase domain-containing protein n=1 Tax=Actinomycetospora chibensis TaxID=663606 RepID=A0ABV9RL38_9PSEU|nr:heparan-alpha-glucosaminide N-acetyltransferase domain-containing protein [Actinomycetospora chibensis]MDD7924672.1 heparan-alpha-glucosaminide N-acetyltransferase domain-containing protein [Actinomycetospora chibensis]